MAVNALRRHLLPLILTPILLMCGWLVIGSPILFVFIIDDAFEISELLKFMLYVIGMGLAISVFVAFPLTLILERYLSSQKITIVLIIGFLLLVSVFILLKFIFDSQSVLETYPWIGLLLLFSFSMALYSSLFWLPRFLRFRSDRGQGVESRQNI